MYVCICVCVCVCVCVFVYVCVCACVCVCNHSTGRIYYQIATKFGTQVGLVNKIQVNFEDGSFGSYRDP